jgi:hypothetical protein
VSEDNRDRAGSALLGQPATLVALGATSAALAVGGSPIPSLDWPLLACIVAAVGFGAVAISRTVRSLRDDESRRRASTVSIVLAVLAVAVPAALGSAALETAPGNTALAIAPVIFLGAAASRLIPSPMATSVVTAVAALALVILALLHDPMGGPVVVAQGVLVGIATVIATWLAIVAIAHFARPVED